MYLSNSNFALPSISQKLYFLNNSKTKQIWVFKQFFSSFCSFIAYPNCSGIFSCEQSPRTRAPSGDRETTSGQNKRSLLHPSWSMPSVSDAIHLNSLSPFLMAELRTRLSTPSASLLQKHDPDSFWIHSNAIVTSANVTHERVRSMMNWSGNYVWLRPVLSPVHVWLLRKVAPIFSSSTRKSSRISTVCTKT